MFVLFPVGETDLGSPALLGCRKLASEDKATVFMTDVLLTSLMCAPRSVYSWDIVVTRAGDKLFFDKRDGSNLDYLTVAETAPESVLEEKDNINGVQQLSQEATGVNQAFSQQVLAQSCLACVQKAMFGMSLRQQPECTAFSSCAALLCAVLLNADQCWMILCCRLSACQQSTEYLQVLMDTGEKYECGSKNPFAGDGNENLASTAYRYCLQSFCASLANKAYHVPCCCTCQ